MSQRRENDTKWIDKISAELVKKARTTHPASQEQDHADGAGLVGEINALIEKAYNEAYCKDTPDEETEKIVRETRWEAPLLSEHIKKQFAEFKR